MTAMPDCKRTSIGFPRLSVVLSLACTTTGTYPRRQILRRFSNAIYSYGLVADLIECLIQRCFSYRTMDVRVTYDYVKACLIDPTVTKVVLIGVSTISESMLPNLKALMGCATNHRSIKSLQMIHSHPKMKR